MVWVQVSIGLLLFIATAVIILWLFLKQDGTKVQLRLFTEISSNNFIELHPHKKIYGRIRRFDLVEKLKVPRWISKIPLEAVSPDFFMLSNTGKPIVHLMKDAEGIYRPIKVNINDRKTFAMKVEDRDGMSWFMNENERLLKKYNTKSVWQQVAPYVTFGLIVMGGLLAIYMTGDKINELNDDYRQQTLGEIKAERNFIMDVVNNINPNNNNNNQVEPSDDAQVPPNR